MFEDKWQVIALLMAGLSGIFFTLCSVMVKLFPELPSSEVVLFRYRKYDLCNVVHVLIIYKNQSDSGVPFKLSCQFH